MLSARHCHLVFAVPSASSACSPPGHSRSLLGKDEPATKVSLFTDTTPHDTDPYGVSSKPEMPWDAQTPVQYTGKKDLAGDLPVARSSVLDGDGVRDDRDNNAVVGEKSVVGMEANDTEDPSQWKGDNFPDAFPEELQTDLRFESEAGMAESADHHPPPAKRARQEAVGEDDL